jgi:hypothetical protein
MRYAVLALGLLALCGVEAHAQHFCSGCGCKGGSGWKINSERGKCVGCKEVATRCREPGTCIFTGWQSAGAICINCREHAPKGLCSLK